MNLLVFSWMKIWLSLYIGIWGLTIHCYPSVLFLLPPIPSPLLLLLTSPINTTPITISPSAPTNHQYPQNRYCHCSQYHHCHSCHHHHYWHCYHQPNAITVVTITTNTTITITITIDPTVITATTSDDGYLFSILNPLQASSLSMIQQCGVIGTTYILPWQTT